MLKIYEEVLLKSSILLVEDETPVRKSFKKVLELWVKEVYEAQDGEEALRIYDKRYPSVIITDVKMPKIDGLEFIEIIRKTNKNIPIVIASAYADKDFLLKSIKLSLVEYLLKPIQESDLIKVLSSCAEKLLESADFLVQLGVFGKYDYQNKTFINAQKEIISLTTKEIEFLELLLKHKGSLVTKQTIEDTLYVYEEAPPSALKNLVFKLRKKIGENLIKSVGKLGYKIE
jgi:DNA-binding response OmpR family regulator